MNVLLVALLVVPLLGAAALLVPGPLGKVAVRFGLVVSGVVFAVSVAVASVFDYADAGSIQGTVDVAWISVARGAVPSGDRRDLAARSSC